jgi:V-type H+-transporting ATPase subunit a
MPYMQICEVYGANRYPFPDDVARQRQMHAEVSGRIRELHTTNEAGERRRDAVLKDIAINLEEWTVMVRKEKAVYHTLNKLSVDVTSKVGTCSNRSASDLGHYLLGLDSIACHGFCPCLQVLIAEAWVPTYAKQSVTDALARTGQASSTQLPAVLQTLTTHAAPPTHFRTSKFTSCFQSIVDAYGVARYREVCVFLLAA